MGGTIIRCRFESRSFHRSILARPGGPRCRSLGLESIGIVVPAPTISRLSSDAYFRNSIPFRTLRAFDFSLPVFDLSRSCASRKMDRCESGDKFVANRVNCMRKRFLRRNRCERLAQKFLSRVELSNPEIRKNDETL